MSMTKFKCQIKYQMQHETIRRNRLCLQQDRSEVTYMFKCIFEIIFSYQFHIFPPAQK